MKDNKKRNLIIGIISLVLLVGVVGITYAFFNYTKTSDNNVLQVGRIFFRSNQTKTINLTNVFPISRETLTTEPTNSNIGTFELEIIGDTDYNEGIEYLVSSVNSHLTTSTGQIVPISLDVEVSNLGTSNTNYFTDRNNKNTTIYKRLSGNGIMGDGMILAGYIKPNTTKGTAEGINGKITIKAFLDTDKIVISDTYDGTESDFMGTTNETVGDRVVLTTTEWNALHENGLSFQVKVEAREGIWIEETLYDILDRQTVMDNVNSTYVSNTTPGIDFSQISSDTNGKGVYTFSSTANDAYPVKYFRGAVTNNNVLFANKCWKMVRTTDTGGVKLIYNGENKGTEEVPNCDNTGTDTQITLNIDEEDKNGFTFSGTGLRNSPAYNGYMWGETVYTQESSTDDLADIYFGTGFTYDTTTNTYTLVNMQKGVDDTHRYTCNEVTANTTCESIRYYLYYGWRNTNNGRECWEWYYTLSGGTSFEEAINEMQQNEVSSNAKLMVDKWYEENLDNLIYSSKIEDTIYCNDRSTSTGGISLIGDSISDYASVYYSGHTRAYETYNPSLSCQKNDAFTVSNPNGNMALEYSIGLIAVDEIMLAGGKSNTINSNYYLISGAYYWTMSPYIHFVNGGAVNEFIGTINGVVTSGSVEFENLVGLRPVLSLKNGTAIVDNDADGTVSNPYIVK